MTRESSWWNLFGLWGDKPRTAARQPVEPADARPIPFNAPRILVVDDDAVIRKTTEAQLRKHGYAVFTAEDGPSAIHVARTEHPDLILLDLDFPPDVSLTWDGFRIMTWLRRLECSKETPIIVCTSCPDDSVIERARNSGVAGVFRKPVDFSSLLGLMEHRLKLLKQQR